MKCIRFLLSMRSKKVIFSFIILSFLGGCASPTSMLGPVYTFTSTGNIAQAGLSYGTNELITNYTGKTPIENLEEIASKKSLSKKNIHKQTLESEDFYNLVTNRIKNTSKILNSSNQ